MGAERLVALMQQEAKGEIDRTTPTDFVYGTVESIGPLVIRVEGKFPVEEEFLVLSPLVKAFITDALKHRHKCEMCDHQTDIQLNPVQVWRGLEVGDRVRMLQCNSGQKFYVLDREGSLP